jgi:hypothetical protein
MATETIDYRGHLSRTWQSAHSELIQNLKQQKFMPQDECSVYANLRGKKVYLPAYIPYMGPAYFEYRPRILCYAINQNLSPHVPWTTEWVNCWGSDNEHAFDRLNRAAFEGRAIPIRPYAEGFIPLVALIAILHWTKRQGGYLPQTIDDIVAVTNFVKFSTSRDASSSSIPETWWRECGVRYAQHEIRILQPDIIICFGQKTFTEVRRVLSEQSTEYKGKTLTCRFPARIPSVKSRPLSGEETKIWNSDILPLVGKIREPKQYSYHKMRTQKFPGYFIDAFASWENEL